MTAPGFSAGAGRPQGPRRISTVRRRRRPGPFQPTEAPNASTVYRPRFAPNFTISLMWVKTVRSVSGVRWWCTQTPAGPSATAFALASGEVRAEAWGPGAQWTIEALPRLLGQDDNLEGFRPCEPLVRGLVDRLGVPRLGATGRWYEALATVAVFQRVVSADARTSVARLGARHGAPSPGGAPVPLFPTPSAVLGLADHDFHRAGVERARARVLRVAAKYADRVEALEALETAEARLWLERLPGVGPWTANRTTSVAAGDGDAVPVGDLHVPGIVSYAFTGDPSGDDARMLELLEPYAGHRGRVVRLIKAAGIHPPRHHPTPSRHDISRI